MRDRPAAAPRLRDCATTLNRPATRQSRAATRPRP